MFYVRTMIHTFVWHAFDCHILGQTQTFRFDFFCRGVFPLSCRELEYSVFKDVSAKNRETTVKDLFERQLIQVQSRRWCMLLNMNSKFVDSARVNSWVYAASGVWERGWGDWEASYCTQAYSLYWFFIRLDLQMRTAESARHSTSLPHPVQVQGRCITLVVTAYICIP